MKRMALGAKASGGKRVSSPTMYVMCVNNDGNPESLDLRKIYRATSDPEGARHGYVRVFDESGEGYLYPMKYFIPVELPKTLSRAARKAFGCLRPSL